jgi:hypothetical protein
MTHHANFRFAFSALLAVSVVLTFVFCLHSF